VATVETTVRTFAEISVMTKTTHKLRPFLPADTAALQDLFAQSIEELTADSYDDAQRAAWIETAEDATAFGAQLSDGLTLVVGSGGEAQGFATLKDNTLLQMLYVHPFSTGQGVGSTLVDALERIAAARGSSELLVEASDTAQPFFEKRGYIATQRNTRMVGDVWLANTTMKKALAPLTPTASKAVS
jgi:putative acetyltransferase